MPDVGKKGIRRNGIAVNALFSNVAMSLASVLAVDTRVSALHEDGILLLED